MAPSLDDLPHPALERVTRVERRIWGAALERQYRSRKSLFRRNLPWYGDVGATYLSVASLWLLQSFTFIVVMFLSRIVENGPLFLVAVVGAFACIAVAAVRTYQSIRVGRSWRQDNGVGRPPRWRSRAVYQAPEGGETTPPIGWAQTSKIPPGWKDPDSDSRS
jgi:hypothetical protein